MKRKLCTLLAALLLLALAVLPAGAAGLAYVTDEAYILGSWEREELESKASEIADTYGVGVYVVTVTDYRDYGSSIYDAADHFYLGYLEGDALLLLLSMEYRDYVILAYGDYAKYVFNTEGLDYLEDFFLDDFSWDDWKAGFDDYLAWSDTYLAAAEAGEPYSYSNAPDTGDSGILIPLVILIAVPFVAAGIYITSLTAKMKSVAMAADANAYVSGGLQLQRSTDHYSYTTTTRRKIEKKSTSGSSSGGGSGRSGKF